jgi:twinkle protein
MVSGVKKCFACGYKEVPWKKTKKETTSLINVKDIEKLPYGGDPTRKISEKIFSGYKVRVAYDEEVGEIKRVYYPHFEGNKMVACKIRTLPKSFKVVGDSALVGLWGKHAVPKVPKFPLYITEGEEDCLALKQIFIDSKVGAHVVSLPNGASIDAAVKRDMDFLANFKEVVICLDTDEPGKRAAIELADYLLPIAGSVFLAELPSKDASDCLVKGMIEETVKAVTTKRRKYEPEGVLSGEDIDILDILKPTAVGYELPYPKLQAKLHGLRKGELTTLCAGSGIGKSTFAKEIGYHLVKKHSAKICHIALEDLVQTVAQSYIAMDNEVPLHTFRFNPTTIDSTDVKRSYEELIKPNYFFKHFGSLKWKSFLAKMDWYARSAKVDFIILDHLSMVISGTEEQNERKAIDQIMTALAKLCVDTGVGIISIVHLKRGGGASGDTGFNEGGQVSMTDLRGSAALEQLSWNVIALERNQQAEDGEEDYSKIRVLKNRTIGFTGVADLLIYNHKTGRLEESVATEEDLLPDEDT